MSDTVIKVENLSKLYNLGQVGRNSFSDDVRRAWARVRGKADPFAVQAEINDRERKGQSDYVWALKDINFEVKKGEVLGILGKNGAGKSTLLKILSRTTSPTTGKFKIKGRLTSLLEVGTGFHPDLTGRENIFLNGAIMGMTKKEIYNKFDEIVDFSGVERYIDTPVKRYSSGMYVRLAFAVAAQLDPEILIIDEVLAVGDSDFQKKCIDRIKSVAENGNTVLFVSHNAYSVRKLCTQAIFLEHGKIGYEGEVERAVMLYFDETKETSVNQFAKIYEKDERPGNDHIRINHLKLVDADGKDITVVTLSKPFFILINFEITQTCNRPLFSVSLHANSGDVVLGSISNVEDKLYQRAYKPGFYSVTCEIPGNLVNNGSFYINVNGYTEEFKNHFSLEAPLGFEAFDDGVLRKEYEGGFGGYIRPRLNWQMNK